MRPLHWCSPSAMPCGLWSNPSFRTETQTQVRAIPSILPQLPRTKVVKTRMEKRTVIIVRMERMEKASRREMEMTAVERTLIWRWTRVGTAMKRATTQTNWRAVVVVVWRKGMAMISWRERRVIQTMDHSLYPHIDVVEWRE